MIVVAGDLFDRRIDYPNDDIALIEAWGLDLLKVCAKMNIMLRLLEGTPSHDWKQSRFFLRLNEQHNINANVLYFDKVDVEYNERLQMNILYVPDEYRHTCKETQVEVEKLLRLKGLTKVQLSVMHGTFPHQIPEKAKHVFNDYHDPVFYTSITEYHISVGHIHTSSTYGIIVPQGSFDRLRHNEEEDKGFVALYIVDTNGVKTTYVKFVVNKDAMMFKTLDVQELSFSEVKNVLLSIKEKVDYGHVRLVCENTHPVFLNLYKLNEIFPEFNLTHKPIKTIAAPKEWNIKDVRDTLAKACLRPDTMRQAILDELSDELKDQTLLDVLDEVLHECNT